MAAPSQAPPVLEVAEGGRVAYRVTIEQSRAVIGRDPDCAVPLLSAYVSWHHATLERRADGVWVTHHTTRNGLLLNGLPLHGSARLRDGDELRVADVCIVFHGTGGRGPGATKAYVVDGADTAAPLGVDRRSRRLLRFGQPVPVSLSPQEFTLLAMLCERPGEVRWHDEVGAAIWGVDRFDINQIHALVKRVRDKLKPHGLAGAIVPVPGVGYRLE